MGLRSVRLIISASALAFFCLSQTVTPAARALWGRIANPMHRGERLISAVYFAGPPNPGNLPFYTRHPAEAAANSGARRDVDYALSQMVRAGLNTLQLSYWGHDGETERYATSLLFSKSRWPEESGTSQFAEAEQVAPAQAFFRQAAAHKLLIAPLLEVSRTNPFWAEFPDKLDNLVGRAVWLLSHFGSEANWLQMTDQDGQPRRVLWLIETIHGAPIAPDRFAEGFDIAAERIRRETGYAVGFVLDPTPLPAYGSHAGPDPAALRHCASVLAINPFNITSQGTGEPQAKLSEADRLAYAESILSKWGGSGIPLIVPILPGYDAHIVFPAAGVYGFDSEWRQRQKELAMRNETAGLSIDCWNGWAEGYAIPPSKEEGDVNLKWITDVIQALQAKWHP
jgi:hypothetical protein